MMANDRPSAPMIGPAKSQGHTGQEGIENWVRGGVEWERWVPSKGRGPMGPGIATCS